MALVAATVTTRLGGSLNQAAMHQARSQWEFTDQQLRLRARRTGQPVALHLEIGTNRLDCTFDVEDESAGTTRTLGRSVTISRYLSATQEITYGPVVIPYSNHGTSETFAIELVGASDGRQWILVTGITGQISEVSDERQARALLEQLLPPRLHAG